ncbi:glycosyltransferase [uncultured Bacteroides sp.]|uniref:glycosyltransferase n=1 Tax=uncultured Bacteroides sp. TaxID=162156 RepID=UPI0026043E19|nr:glycosyltransferase [uncultured Bacteroides sp.]
MKKILFITPYVPYPLDSGGNQAFFNMVDYIRRFMSVSILLYPHVSQHRQNIESLKKIWPDVTFYVFEEQVPKARHPFYYKLLDKIERSAARKMRRQVRASIEKEKQHTVLFESTYNQLPKQYLEYVAEISRKGFDFIQVEFYELVSLGYILPQEAETIFVHHELRFIRNENELSLFPAPTPLDRMCYEVAKNYERDALRTYKHIITLTETDRNILKDFIGQENIHTSPAVIQIPRNENICFKPAEECRLTFIGSGLHAPNKDAVTWFIKEIHPLLCRANLPFTLEVIGAWDKKSVHEFSQIPHVKMAGFVDDLHSYLNGSISIVPIRIGSGMRIKILDSIAARTPIITTTKGVEGLDLRNHMECLIADTPEAFAEAIMQLGKDTALQQRLSEQADLRLQKLYNPGILLETRMEIYRKISLGDFPKK